MLLQNYLHTNRQILMIALIQDLYHQTNFICICLHQFTMGGRLNCSTFKVQCICYFVGLNLNF